MRRQAARVDLEQRDVGELVGANHLRPQVALVGERHAHLGAARERAEHVHVREHVAIGRDDDAGAERQVTLALSAEDVHVAEEMLR